MHRRLAKARLKAGLTATVSARALISLPPTEAFLGPGGHQPPAHHAAAHEPAAGHRGRAFPRPRRSAWSGPRCSRDQAPGRVRQPRGRARRRTPRGVQGACAPTQNDRTCNLPKLDTVWTRPVKPGLAVHNQNPGRPNTRPPRRGARTIRSTRMHPDNNQDRTWRFPGRRTGRSAPASGCRPPSPSPTGRWSWPRSGDGPAVIANPLRARDTTLAAAARAAGPGISRKSPNPERPGVSRPGNPRRVPR